MTHKIHTLLGALAPIALVATLALAEPLPSPLLVTQTSPDGVATLQLDPARYETMRSLDRAEVSNFTLGPGLAANLTLSRFEVLAPDAQVIGAEGVPNAARPDVQLWRGSVDGVPGSYVYLALTPHGTSGYIHTGETTYIISSGEQGQAPTVVYDLASPAGAGINFEIPSCGGAILAPGEQLPPPEGESNPYAPRSFTCRRFSIAIDCDTEFTANRFSGNHTNAQAYATTLLGAVSEIYNRDANITLEVAYLRTWGPNDPYTAANNSEMLPDFKAYWQANMGSVNRSLAHLLSPRSLGGGIAYLRGACNANGYAVSANLNGFFPYPLQDRRSQNWDVMVVAHELGHNLGTGHTHDPGSYNPIIDGCGSSPQDCSVANQGTIMSYCHTCSGGMSNINLNFGTRVVNAIRNYIDLGPPSVCGSFPSSSTTITQHPIATTVNENQSVTLSVVTSGEAPIGYQWKRNSGILAEDARIQGTTTANLTINPAQFSDIASYQVVVMSRCGPITSQSAWLTVVTCPIIPLQPQDTSADVGQPATFTIDAGGTFPRTYQWRLNSQALTNTSNITGATTNTLRFTAVTPADAGTYDVVVTNPCGQATSNPAILTVTGSACGTSDFNGDGDYGTDADIEAFFACLAGDCCSTCYPGGSDFNADGDFGTDADIESFFRVLGGGSC